jgi:hypothetical protein
MPLDISFFVLGLLEFELRALHLLGRSSATWTTTQGGKIFDNKHF